MTDTEFFTMSAIHSMQLACEEIFLKNMTYWKPNQNKNGTLEPRLDLKREMCPGLCSGNGVCTNSICKCNEPFTGDDCSVNKKVPPTIESLGSNGLCDAKKHNDCHIVWIRGSDFLDSENLACRTTYITVCFQLNCKNVSIFSFSISKLSIEYYSTQQTETVRSS